MRVKGHWKLHMKFVDEFRDPVAAEGLLAAISETVDVLGATGEKP